jgi:hypothetical protein
VWGTGVFDIKADGLAMELRQMSSHTTTTVVDKYVALGLVSINRQHKGKERLKLTVG